MPRVSVLMPVYNGEEHLRQAIASILEQSFRDLELIIVSEAGTSQASLEIIASFTDPRIVHLHNAERLGLSRSLNRGAEAARGEYLARMDADDVALPERLEKQAAFLDAHPEVSLLGTAIAITDSAGGPLGRIDYPRSPGATAMEAVLRTPLAHPTVMMRRESFVSLGGYDPLAKSGEDYLLWLRALRQMNACSLHQPLLRYRWHGSNATLSGAKGQADRADRAALAYVNGREEDLRSLSLIRNRALVREPGEASQAAGLLLGIWRELPAAIPGARRNREAAASYARIWISLILRSRGGLGERGSVLLTAARALGPRAILALPQGFLRLITYSATQGNVASGGRDKP